MGLGLWDMIVVVVVVGVAGGVFTEYLKTKRRQPVDDQGSAETNERLAKLEERVITLERIVTDGKRDLKAEIDAL